MHAIKIGLEIIGALVVVAALAVIILGVAVEKDYEGGGNPFE